jgi:ATP-dependent helicase/nuclease subunit A
MDDAKTGALRAAAKNSMMAEYRRLLYVALTRAEDRLYICGAQGDKKVSEESWYHLAKQGLERIAEALEDGTLRLGTLPTPQQKTYAPHEKIAQNNILDFTFLTQPPAPEPAPSQPITP